MKAVLYMAMTVNGIVATKKGQITWSDAIWKNYFRVARAFRTIVIGRKAFDLMEPAEFKKIGNPFTIVITDKKTPSKDRFVFVNSAKSAMEAAEKRKAGKLLVGGDIKIISAFMKENMVDEIWLDVEPLAVGTGIQMFKNNFESKLKLLKVTKISKDVVHLRYRIVKK